VAAEIAAPAISALSEQAQTVAVAESLTGGLLCSALVEVPGASAVVRGGVVAYATDLKQSLLGVDGDLLARKGPVDPDVAAQMARGVRERLGADWGVATTGVAGPGPQDGVPAGTVYVGIDGPGGAQVLELDLPGGRVAVRAAATERAIGALLAAIRALQASNHARNM
jgi:nicotinamide-nucleotide amidase